MRKTYLLSLVLMILTVQSNAQIEVSKLLGKNSSHYKLGYGAFFKLGVPVSPKSEVTIEWSPKFIFAKSGDGEGIGLMPVMAGYRYLFSESGSGIYVEPQVGYNFYEDIAANGDGPYKGLAWAIGTGYLSPAFGNIRLNPGIKYETVHGKGGFVQNIAFRFAVNFALFNRE